jgi:hypothetical protein
VNTPPATEKPRRWMQFGLKTLLFIVLCICGMLAGYRVGLYQGTETKRRQSNYAQTYRVADLTDLVMTPNGTVESYTTLIDLITDVIDPGSWQEVGGPGTISEFPASNSLVINQTGENHDRIKTLIAELRQNKKLAGAKQPSR